MEKTLCFTGHRKVPGKSYGEWLGVGTAVMDIIRAAYIKGFRNFICGGAIGFDTLAATAVLKATCKHYDIDLIMAIPFRNQPWTWPAEVQDNYHTILSQADRVVYVDEELGLDNPGIYAIDKMFIRNKYMVDASDAMVACVSDVSTSGSAHCIRYAQSKGVPILIINPNTLEKRWILNKEDTPWQKTNPINHFLH